MNDIKTAIVIGAGIGGLAAAIRLKRKGYNVTVYESSLGPGGKIKEYKWERYRFDTGPSLFTLPELVTELFELCEKDYKNYFTYEKLPLVTKYFFDDGIQVSSYAGKEDFANEVFNKLQFDKTEVLRFLKQQEETYEYLAPIFIENPIHIFNKLIRFKNIPALIHLLKPYFVKTMARANDKAFTKESHLTKIFNRYGTYNGSNPYKMPSLFNIIAHLEHNKGAYLPSEGMYQIVKAIWTLAKEEGVDFVFNSYVEEILTKGKTAIGIRVSGNECYANVIISNMDVNNTYSKLLPHVKSPTNYLNKEKSTSALIFHWAIKGNFARLDVHNILFAKEYKEEFNALFTLKKIYHDPTVYIYISSKVVETDAPIGCENWFVMINTPNLLDPGNSEWKELGRKYISNKINNMLHIDIEKYIEHEHVITPRDLSDTTHSFLGSLYGSASNSMMSAFFRHPNFSKVKNLYFCGGTVHPGGGIPLCLYSAKITTDLIAENYNNHPND